MFYDRKIKYLDYYENGGRIKGCGFAKMEVRDGSLRVELAIVGLHSTDSFERDVILCAGSREKTVGKIMIYGGKGQYRQACDDLNNLGGTGISYEELDGIRISIGTGREVSCRWMGPHTVDRMIKEKRAESAQSTGNIPKADSSQRVESVQRADNISKSEGIQRADSIQRAESIQTAGNGPKLDSTQRADRTQRADSTQRIDRTQRADGTQRTDRTQSTDNTQKVDSVQGTANIQEDEMGAARRDVDNKSGMWTNEMEIQNMEQDIPDSADDMRISKVRKEYSAEMPETRLAKNEERAKIPVKLMEDKWSQLWAIYPHVRPFRDDREYLSVGPADFVLFPSEAYKMVNNSFLLHGYYNYGHLILTKIEKKGEVFYYVGVPGNYFEREKQVAVMFGFESFECAEEPAQTGDFGYYMMRTQL